MKSYHTEPEGRRCPSARSASMQLEEIERERVMSGWNPYAGEEERWSPFLPYFQQPDYTQILERQREEEKSLRRLQTMYPETAKQIMPYVEDACDQMEYEGSPMFDEYPDRTTIYRLCEQIQSQAESVGKMGDRGSDFQASGCSGPNCPGPDFPGPDFQRSGPVPNQNPMGELIQVLLLSEMHHRRCRHQQCRQGQI